MNDWLVKFFTSMALCTLLVCACSKTPSTIIFHQPATVKTDSITKWLSKRAYFHNENYYPVFRNYYAKQLARKNFKQVALALEELTEQEMYYSFFQESTLDTIHSFQKHYEQKLPWFKTLFVESYLGNYYINQANYKKAIPYFRKLIRYKPFDYSTYVEVGHGYGDLAFCYFAMGKHELALRYNAKALALFNQTDNYIGRGGIYDNMALVNLYTKNYSDAELCFNKAMNDYKRKNDIGNVLVSLHNKIILYQEMDSPKQFELIDSTYHLFVKSKIKDESLDVALSSFYVDMLLHEGRNSEAKAVLFDMKQNIDRLKSAASDVDYNVALANYEIKAGEGIKDIELIEKAFRTVEEEEDYQNQVAFSGV